PMPHWSNHRLRSLLGIESSPVSHHERWLSMAGGLLGIALVFAAAALHPLGAGSALVVASMGASAVLVFAVPHGALSQPWPVLGGHLISACVGVTVAKLPVPPALAGPMAVGIAILAMHYARCLHPPGGATALAAVIGGNEILALGYGYLLAPVLVNVALLLLAGVAFNYPFRWRRYPAALVRTSSKAAPTGRQAARPPDGALPPLAHEDLIYALGRVDSFIDVSEEDLVRIYDLAARHAGETQTVVQDVRPGRCYSNERFGADWAVRCIVDASDDPKQDLVIYRGVAGADRRTSGTMSRGEFARWARHEVERDETTWRRVVRQDSEAD
ncbi:MAG: HPP family protein, partial [Thiohalocapsa sp.]